MGIGITRVDDDWDQGDAMRCDASDAAMSSQSYATSKRVELLQSEATKNAKWELETERTAGAADRAELMWRRNEPKGQHGLRLQFDRL